MGFERRRRVSGSVAGASLDGPVVVADAASASGLEAFRWENKVMIGLSNLADFGFRDCPRQCMTGTSAVIYSPVPRW